MIKTYKYKLYNSKKTKELNTQTKICGNIYNHCIALHLRYYKTYHVSLNKYKLQKHLTKLKKMDKHSFWNQVGSQAIQDITDRIERSYKAFFNNCKKKKKTRKVSPPSFQKSRNYSSFTLKQAGYKFLPLNQVKIGKRIYKYWKCREIKGDIKCVTVKKDKLGDWYIYVVCNNQEIPKLIPMTGKTAGFDFGCTDFLVKNDSTKIQSPQFFKKNRNKIKKANQKLSKKVKGSNNFYKSKRNLVKLHKYVANCRRDFHFKLANKLCSEYDIMYFETLDINSMKKVHGKKINDLGFSDFMSILKNKALEYGRTIYCIDRWFASSKTCNHCGIKYDLGKYETTWICPSCKTKHNRDYNAAINIFNEGTKNIKEFMDGASSISTDDIRLGLRQAVVA